MWSNSSIQLNLILFFKNHLLVEKSIKCLKLIFSDKKNNLDTQFHILKNDKQLLNYLRLIYICCYQLADNSLTICLIWEEDLPISYRSRKLKAHTETKVLVVTASLADPRLKKPSLLNTNPLDFFPAEVVTYP